MFGDGMTLDEYLAHLHRIGDMIKDLPDAATRAMVRQLVQCGKSSQPIVEPAPRPGEQEDDR